MNIYVASSWRNTRQPAVVRTLRELGHDVYDFRNPRPGDDGFSWKQILDKPPQEWTTREYRDEVLAHDRSRQGFTLDMNALVSCDACVLVLPCGRSAHLELGQAVGAGKRTLVLLDDKIDEPELMYLMCSKIVLSLDELCEEIGEGTSDMEAHSSDREWQYVVPPQNRTRVIITQRQDGPFRGDPERNGHFYVSVETMTDKREWKHVAGSTVGGIRSLLEAKKIASRIWREEYRLSQ